MTRFKADSTMEMVTRTGEELGLHPRDLFLFTLGKHAMPQRATIRGRGATVHIRTELCKAIICRDHAYVFPARRPTDDKRIAALLQERLRARLERRPSEAEEPPPFEMVVLETLLEATSFYFEQRWRHLAFITHTVLADILAGHPALGGKHAADLKRLLQMEHALTELKDDVRELCVSIDGILADDKDLAAICLSEPHSVALAFQERGKATPAMSSLATILEAFEGRFRSTEGAVRQLQERIDVNREIWHMRSDGNRNRIMTINMFISMTSLSLMVLTVPSAIFGMNLYSGLEATPGLFWPTVAGSVCASATAFTVLLGFYRYFGSARHKRQVQDMQALHDILIYRLDDLEDIMSAISGVETSSGGHIDHKDFSRRVRAALGEENSITEAEINLLYRVFDTNRDGLLELSEVIGHQNALSARSAGPLVHEAKPLTAMQKQDKIDMPFT